MESGIQASGFVIQPRLRFKYVRDQMLYQYLLSRAEYRDKAELSKGKTIIKITHLSEELGWTRKEISFSLKRLEKEEYITKETLLQKRGTLITIVDYENLQNLTFYKKKDSIKGQEKGHEDDMKNNGNGHEDIPEIIDITSVEDDVKINKGHEKGQEEGHEKGHLISITAFINSIININKTLKEYIVDAPVKNKNLSSIEDIKTFVDFASQTNALPQGANLKIIVSYFDCIRLTRSTCTVSANILVKFIEKIHKYSANQIHYAMWKHVEQHDDKKESYTLGIMRNTNEHEARRGLMKLKNKGGGTFEKLPGSSQEGSKYEYGF
ncbi:MULTISPECIES: winged helix-turn-helix domain-containing protein [Bacillus]|uniref:Uncharacterized protein n=1 Tax=Bacillus capparidis TaxID=1840411 RepID=A0ABS4CU17_9BACI|nr:MULTISPECIES: winged helix-turn-helix domain-containing protein [Bacillus]MBP1080835.1 hypothetical protein [Bacillus capparidis]MED1097479.1 winged helix-turn-helix domain-containing protein [Bacillus capparidis]